MRFTPKNKGFSLVELIVAMAIFSIVVLLAVGSLLVVTVGNRRTNTNRTVNNNMSFAMEDMVRNLRGGNAYHCGTSGTLTDPRDCLITDATNNFLTFKTIGSLGDDQVVYRLTTIGGKGVIEKSTTGGPPYTRLTDPSVDVKYLKFVVTGSLPSDNIQSRVVISMQGVIAAGTRQTATSTLQTMVTQRLADK